MNIQQIEIPETDSAPKRLIMQINKETLIMVDNFGTEEAVWTVVGYQPAEVTGYNPLVTIQNFFEELSKEPEGSTAQEWFLLKETFGRGGCMVDPVTFAHMVINLLENI